MANHDDSTEEGTGSALFGRGREILSPVLNWRETGEAERKKDAYRQCARKGQIGKCASLLRVKDN